MNGGLTRRTLLQLSVGAALGAAIAVPLSSCARKVPSEIRIASGEKGGMYYEFATLLADSLVLHGLADSAHAIETEASVQNLQMLTDGSAQLSLVLADAAAQYREDSNSGQPVALGRVYQNYFHCIVRSDGKIKKLWDLEGHRIGTGATGSGTWLTGQRILQQTGLKSSENPPEEFKYGYASGIRALQQRRIDALFLFGGMPVAAVADLAHRIDLRLLDLDSVLPGLRSSYPGLYDQVQIPAGTYERVAVSNSIGVANLLMVSSQFDVDLAGKIVRLLVDGAEELIPRETAGMQFLSPQTLISTAGQPLHPGARKAYRELHG